MAMRRATAKLRVHPMRADSLLLVGSDAAGRRAAARALQGRGFRVAQAATAAQASAQLGASPTDAVLLDVGDDPDAVLVVLARIHAARPRLPVIVVGEACKLELAMCSFEMGAVDVVPAPADIDHLASRVRSLIATRAKAPREKTIADLMIPASAYRRVYEDEPVRRAIKVLTESLFHQTAGKFTEKGHRSVLVYSRKEAFLGCLRLNDILEVLIPPASRETSAPFETGMLIARCKLLGEVTAGELLGEQRFVDIEAPLMEAVQLLVFDGLINIPVLENGEVAGLLTDRNLLLEIYQLTTDEQ